VKNLSNSKIRVVFCTYPGIFADTVLNTLQQNQPIEIIGLVHSTRIFSAKETWLNSALRLINTSGLSYAILQFLQTDVHLLLRKFSRFIPADKKVPVYRTKNINTPEGLAFLKSLNADVILLANFNQKVCADIISLPRLACLNIHPSLLPDYKGVDPVFAALYGNEKKLGVSVHVVDKEFDTGNILAQSEIATDTNASVFYHHLQLFQQGAKLAAHIIQNLPDSLVKQVQNGNGNYDSWPTKAKIKAFKQRGGKLIRLSEYIDALKKI
jgi:methionyl-tRNA formyltransferase